MLITRLGMNFCDTHTQHVAHNNTTYVNFIVSMVYNTNRFVKLHAALSHATKLHYTPVYNVP